MDRFVNCNQVGDIIVCCFFDDVVNRLSLLILSHLFGGLPSPAAILTVFNIQCYNIFH